MKKENISKNAVFLCTICQQEFRKIEIYDKHCIETHSNSVEKKKRGSPKKNIHENANECEICGKQQKTPANKLRIFFMYMRDSKKKIWNSIFTEYQFIRFKACIHFFQVKNLISVSSVEKHSVNLQI